MSENLFSDGWRDPTDDVERAGNYLLAATGFFTGPLMVWFGVTMFSPCSPCGNDPSVQVFSVVMGILGIAMGIAFPIGAYLFFRSESKHWNLKKMTADRFVAGGMLAGLGLVWIGFQGGDAGGLVALTILGAIVFLLFLAIGLVCAYWPAKTRVLRNVLVVQRYALDDKLQEHSEAVAPSADGWTPVIEVKNIDGKVSRFPAREAAYETAEVGTEGDACVQSGRLVNFRPRFKNPC